MNELKNNEYLKTMKPMLYLMKCICALPIHLKSQDVIPYFISSKVVTFMVLATYIIVHVLSMKYNIRDVLMDESITNIITIVAKGPDIILESFCLAGPMLMWNRKKEMEDYWETWENFQLKYESIKGELYVSKKRRYIKMSAFVCIVWITQRCLYAAWFHYHIFAGIIDFIVYSYLLLEVYVISIYWFSNCVYFWSLSEDVLDLGKKIISEKKEDEKLNRLVSAWSSMNDLTNHFIEAHSFLFLSFLSMIVIILVAACYALLNYSIYSAVYPLTYYFYILAGFLIILIIICESAYSIYAQIHYRQKEALLQENTMELEPAALKSVLRFLQTISSQDSAIDLNGFVTLNRMEFPTIVSLCVYYLIVLRQFSEG